MHLRMHTDCIQSAYKHIKREEEREILLLLLSYIACSYIFYCPFFRRSSSTVRVFRHSSTNHECSTACFRRRWAFLGFHRPSDGLSATIPTHFLTYDHHTPLRAYTQSVHPIGFIAWMDGRKACMHCMHQKTDYACYAKTQLRN